MVINALENVPDRDYIYAKDELSLQIIEIMRLCRQKSNELLDAFRRRDSELVQQHLSDLQEGLAAFWEAAGQSGSMPKDSHVADMLENAFHTLEQFVNKVNMDEDDRAEELIAYQLCPFLDELLEDFYFWNCVRPSGSMGKYYQEEFAKHHRGSHTQDAEGGIDVSIFIPAYNKLEYTKRCVESILAHTDFKKHSCAMYLINHGSTDGTQEYFESIPNAKVIQFKKNVRMLMFSTVFRVVQGRYSAFVSNDTVVTKGWLDNLLQCVSSSPRIISATPVTPNISNLQAVPESYKDLEEMHRFAEKMNVSNPDQWDRRARIMPVIALYNNKLVKEIGFADRLFKTMEFWDDDFSLRARRKGYEQMLCGDTFCHHYGSVTGREAQIKENTLEKGRELFIEKNGVDAWGTGFCYDLNALRLIEELTPDGIPGLSHADILGVDAGFGDTSLQIGNFLRLHKRSSSIHHITGEEAYAPDLQPLSDGFFFSHNRLPADVKAAFGQKAFHYIYIGIALERYADWAALLEALSKITAENGVLIASFTNPFYIENMFYMLSLSFPPREDRLAFLNMEAVLLRAKACFTQSGIVSIENKSPQLDSFIINHYGAEMDGNTRNEIYRRLSVQRYILWCKK